MTKNTKNKRYATKLLEAQAFCTGRETCIVFLEDSLAAFGPLDQLRNLLLTRQGAMMRLSQNSDAVQLLNGTSHAAPVRGVLLGQQLQAAVSNAVHDWSSGNVQGSRLASTVTGIGYSVAFDSKEHVSATIECTSGTAAALLSQTVSALGMLQSATASVVGAKTGLPFDKVQVSSSGKLIHFYAEGALPSSVPAGR